MNKIYKWMKDVGAKRSLGKKVLWGILLLSMGVFVTICVAEWYVWSSSSGRMYDDVKDIPQKKYVGLVLGCSPYLRRGADNPYFYGRMAAAVALWKAGKLTAIIVSGDNRRQTYNEPEFMRRALEKYGVPDERIVCDYAGLRTLDSVVRAKEIFGVQHVIIISQAYHNERALAIASHYDIEAIAFNATDVALQRLAVKSWFRERAARVAMLLDLWILDTQPKHMGRKELLPQ